MPRLQVYRRKRPERPPVATIILSLLPHSADLCSGSTLPTTARRGSVSRRCEPGGGAESQSLGVLRQVATKATARAMASASSSSAAPCKARRRKRASASALSCGMPTEAWTSTVVPSRSTYVSAPTTSARHAAAKPPKMRWRKVTINAWRCRVYVSCFLNIVFS